MSAPRVRVLPLFPLPIVLFPGALKPLYVFEPRYRHLVRDVVESDGQFGIVYHDPDRHGPFLNEPDTVGTLASVRHVEPAGGGRSWIMVRGEARFRIVEERCEGKPYYQADVALMIDEARPGLAGRRTRSVSLVRRLAAIHGQGAPQTSEIDTSQDVSFALARTVEIDAEWQQALLALTREDARLDRIDAVFEAAIAKGERK